jgi:hypothetical protein
MLASCAQPPAPATEASPSGATPPTPPALAPSASQPDARTPTATSTSTAPAFPRILYDAEAAHAANAPKNPRLLPASGDADEKAILDALFPNRTDSCWTPDLKERPEMKGRFAARVDTRVEGAFTESNAHETLFTIDADECGAGARTAGRVLAVARGRALLAIVRSFAPTVAAPIASVHDVFDLDGDGRLEVLVVDNTLSYGGYMTGAAGLVRFQAAHPADSPAAITSLRDFGDVYESNCASTDAKRIQHVTVIRAMTSTPRPADLNVEKKTAPCR